MKKITLLAAISFCILFTKLYAQVGIGTATPNAAALLQVDAGTSTTKGLLITGTFNSTATVPNLGAGSRLMFYPGKAAFRAGFVNSNQWDDFIVGPYSVAMGNNTAANGNSSTAMGNNTFASGDNSTAMGNFTTAGGNSSTAMGLSTTASGTASTAMGNSTNASGIYSVAMGLSNNASGYVSTAMGNSTTASGFNSTSMGVNASTNSHAQSFCIGGGTNNNNIFPMVANNADNQMMMYFDNYTFYSGTGGQGVALTQNSNSWVTICDKNKKENFEQLNGEDVLNKLSKINFTSWNYKDLDPKKYRHYGIMAQDFYGAFGKDKYGVIGNDTTVNPIDMIGIDMAAIQALEKRTQKMEAIQKNNFELQQQLQTQQKENTALKQQFTDLALAMAGMKKQLNGIVAKQNETTNNSMSKK